jgi:hypothetical protein
LKEILKFQPFDVHEIVEQFSEHPGFQNNLLNDIDDGVVVALKNGAVLCSLYKDNISLGYLSLKPHAVLEIAEVPQQFRALEVELLHAVSDLPLFWIVQAIHNSMSWSNSSTVRRS